MSENAPVAPEGARWWGETRFDDVTEAFWAVGALRLWVSRLPFEWRINFDQAHDVLDEANHRITGQVPELLPDATERRFGLGEEDSRRLNLLPLVSDRPVVVRPETAFHILPGDRVRFFVGTPLVVGLSVGRGRRPLTEVPCYRLSDTWFGADTTEGELCYASRTSARLAKDQLLHPPGRAVTQITVYNEAPGTLAFTRLKVPLPRLALFADNEWNLWTSSIDVRRAEDGTIARLQIGDGAGESAGAVAPVSDARERRVESGRLVRAVSAMLGN